MSTPTPMMSKKDALMECVRRLHQVLEEHKVMNRDQIRQLWAQYDVTLEKLAAGCEQFLFKPHAEGKLADYLNAEVEKAALYASKLQKERVSEVLRPVIHKLQESPELRVAIGAVCAILKYQK